MDSNERYPEQDAEGGDNLPTYDDLAERHGANSRFGRWRSWIEKRAAERYADTTQEDLDRRRQRGWGDNLTIPDPEPPYAPPLPERSPARSAASLAPPTPERLSLSPVPPLPPRLATPEPGGSGSSQPRLSVQTLIQDLPSLPPVAYTPDEYSAESQAPAGQVLDPSHLIMTHFGSRFLAHSQSQIHTILPLTGDRLLLFGHDEGLSVLNMFPQEWGEDGLVSKGPADAQALPIWEGEAVYQMSILEIEYTGDSIPQGVVLCLVGKEGDENRSLRMHNLASLISLAKWAVAHKGTDPLQLGRPAGWTPQGSHKRKSRVSGNFTRGIRSLIEGSPVSPPDAGPSYDRLVQTTNEHKTPPRRRPEMTRHDSSSGWDMVDELPLRWATDYVPLASAGSRLANSSVLTFAVWRDLNHPRGNALLAVATKSSVLLYESPKGERAFRFLKDFYTPVSPRNIKFVQQLPSADPMSRSPSDVSMASYSKHKREGSSATLISSHGHGHSRRHMSTSVRPVQYGQQLSLFVVFEKKAGLIRLVDSAVAEVELYDDTGSITHSSSEHGGGSFNSLGPSSSRHSRKGRGSGDGFAFVKDGKGHWILPAETELPIAPGVKQGVCCLTRGVRTHVLPNPLPANIALTPPWRTFVWRIPPTSIEARVIYPSEAGEMPYLQLIAASQDGLEVQELSAFALLDGKGKGRPEEPVRSQTEFGGDTGLLLPGGHWDRPYDAPLARSYSTSSTMTYDSMDTEDLHAKLQKTQGHYGWQRRAADDWRIFWVGGTGSPDLTTDE
ncbi:unnamed protein product [Peniophora sp. CBMAI 1063]|nr:unnamed protein product [Peniophora sp. CBMAI 1063]